MHLALPTRRSSNPPVYATRSSKFPTVRRSRVQALVLSICGFGVLLFLLSRLFGGDGIPSGTPPVVIITVLDPSHYSKDYIENIKDNRIEYANKHGMAPLMYAMCKELKLIFCRLQSFPTYHHRLQPTWLAQLMVSGTCPSTCAHKVPPHNLLLVP